MGYFSHLVAIIIAFFIPAQTVGPVPISAPAPIVITVDKAVNTVDKPSVKAVAPQQTVTTSSTTEDTPVVEPVDPVEPEAITPEVIPTVVPIEIHIDTPAAPVPVEEEIPDLAFVTAPWSELTASTPAPNKYESGTKTYTFNLETNLPSQITFSITDSKDSPYSVRADQREFTTKHEFQFEKTVGYTQFYKIDVVSGDGQKTRFEGQI